MPLEDEELEDEEEALPELEEVVSIARPLDEPAPEALDAVEPELEPEPARAEQPSAATSPNTDSHRVQPGMRPSASQESGRL